MWHVFFFFFHGKQSHGKQSHGKQSHGKQSHGISLVNFIMYSRGQNCAEIMPQGTAYRGIQADRHCQV